MIGNWISMFLTSLDKLRHFETLHFADQKMQMAFLKKCAYVLEDLRQRSLLPLSYWVNIRGRPVRALLTLKPATDNS